MKRLLLFTVLLLTFSNIVISQTAFYDAQYLSTISKSELNNILSASNKDNPEFNKSTGKTPPLINLSEHETKVLKDYILFLDNPFDNSIENLDLPALKSSIVKYNKYVESKLSGGSGMGILSPGLGAGLSLISNAGGGNLASGTDLQTKIIDGLTKYYAEEFKKAQLITYMQTFNSTIGKIGELQVLFPATYAKLQNADPSRFPELGDEYKSIFNEDLKSLPDNLINHIDNYKEVKPKSAFDKSLKWLTYSNDSIIKSNEYYDCFKITADLSSKLINNYRPVDLFNYLDHKYYKASLLQSTSPKKADKIALIIHELNLIQGNLLDTTKSKGSQFANVWLNIQDLKKLNSKNEWIYFSGLIYQQDKVFFNKIIWDATGKTSLTAIEQDTVIARITPQINSILSALIELQNFKANLKDENVKDNFIGYMSLVLKSIESANLGSTSKILPEVDFKKYLQIADYTINIYDDARKKDYSNIIYYSTEILNGLLITKSDNSDVINKIEQYGSFMTDVINAKNSDDIKVCIKKYAAPPTSFILKREYRTTFSITGQPGYFASGEKLDGKHQNFAFVSGITLPMGFELTFKTQNIKENSGSIGFFAQLVDLGAVLNFRVGDSSSTLPNKINFQQVFSPGGSITYGFKNSPLTIGIGYQYTPQLRSISLNNGNQIFPNGHRIFLRLAWDIPLVNIANSKKKYKIAN